jgi:predicted ATPase
VQFDGSSVEVWSDVSAFEALSQQKPRPRACEHTARKLYVGDFLAGLRLEDSPVYERWREEQAKTYRQQLLGLFPHNLPRQGTTFIGREEEMGAIMRKVLEPDYPLITLMGTGGVGKTRLALSVGQKARGHFNDGVWWVPLAGLEKADAASLPERLATAIGQALNLTFKANEQTCPSVSRITEQLFKHLRQFDALLLLDNLEHLLPARLDEESAAVDFMLDLLRQTENLKIIVTSRQRLNVPEEFVFGIEGLLTSARKDKPVREVMADKESDSALTLFAERANRLGPRFELSARNLPLVKRICQELAGLPLGIELAAGLLARWPVAEIAETMIKAQNRLALSASWRSLPPRQRSLWALFEHSWHLLTPRQQETFAQLAVFHSGFLKKAASNVIHATQADLEALLAKSLLHFSAEGRFQMHALVRDFAAQKLALRGDVEVQERHASYYLAFLAQQEKKIEEASNREPLNETQRDLNNIRAAWRWAVAQSKVELLRQSASGFRLLVERLGLIKEGLAAMESAIKQLRAPTLSQAVKETRAVLLLQQTILLDKTTQFGLALRCIQEAAQLARSPQTLGQVTYHWALICRQQANYEGAQEKFLQARTFFRQAGDRGGQKQVFRGLATLAYSLEDYAKAGEYYEQLYNLTPYEKNTRFKGAIILNLGVIHRMQGHYNEALLYQEKALKLFGQIGEPFWEGLAMVNHALLALHLGNYEQATSYFEQTDKLWQPGGFERLKDGLYTCWGLLHHHLGDHQKALAMAEQAKEVSQAKGDVYYLGFAYLLIGHAKRGLGLKEEAQNAYQEALRSWQANHKQKAVREAQL